MVNVRWKMAFGHLCDAQLDVRLGALILAEAWQNRATEVVATGTEVVGDPECGLMSRVWRSISVGAGPLSCSSTGWVYRTDIDRRHKYAASLHGVSC